MGACIVLGVASLAIALLFRSTAFAQTSPAPNDVVHPPTQLAFRRPIPSAESKTGFGL
jgi:hypothetical protein